MPLPSVNRGSDAIGSALTLAVAVTLFCWGGYRLDLSLDTSPLFLILGAALGLVGGFIHLLRVLAPDLRLFGSRRAGRAEKGSDATTGKAVGKKVGEDVGEHDAGDGQPPRAPF